MHNKFHFNINRKSFRKTDFDFVRDAIIQECKEGNFKQCVIKYLGEIEEIFE